jgi:hypothetical protein
MTIFRNKKDKQLYIIYKGGTCICRGQCCGTYTAYDFYKPWISFKGKVKLEDFEVVAVR